MDVLLLIGLIQYQKKDFTAARNTLQQVLKLSPTYLDAELGLIHVFIAENQFNQAHQMLQKAIEQAPNNPRIIELQLFLKKVEASPVENTYPPSIVASLPNLQIQKPKISPPELKLNSNSASPTFNAMLKLREQHQIDKALQMGKEYLKQHPNDFDVLLQMGLIQYQKKDFTTAATTFRQVLTHSPHYLDAKIGLIRTLIAQQQFMQAQSLIAQIEHQAPHHPNINALKTLLQKARREKSQPSPVIASKEQNDDLKTIIALREKKEFDKAIQLGEKHLKKFPKDADVMYYLGLIHLQKKEFIKAETLFTEALKVTPNYLDVKIALATLAISQNKLTNARQAINQLKLGDPNKKEVLALETLYEKAYAAAQLSEINKLIAKHDVLKAEQLAIQYLKQNPKNIDIRLQLCNIYIIEKKYQQAKDEYQMILELQPQHKTALLGLINVDILAKKTYEAQLLIRLGLLIYPNDPEFLLKKAQIDLVEHKIAIAADKTKTILKTYPNNKSALGFLKELKSISPFETYGLNGLGGNGLVYWVPELRSYWEFSTAYYNRNTDRGNVSFLVNNASRYGFTDNQYMITASPIINSDLSVTLTGARSNQPILFPKWFGGAEALYSGVPLPVSLGYSYSFIIRDTTFSAYTASLSKYGEHYQLMFRPYYYQPSAGKSSALYTATLIRYFYTLDCFVNFNFGIGTTPNLADLLAADFIITKTKYVNLTVQIPLLNHHLLASIGGSYQHWTFVPGGQVLQLSGGTVGLKYKF